MSLRLIRTTLVPVIAILGLAMGAADEPPKTTRSTMWGLVINAVYIHRPDASAIGHFFPKHALTKDVSGAVLLRCVATAAGGLRDCSVAAEAPTGWGFGEAALRMAPIFNLDPRMSDGQSIEGRIVPLPMRFLVEGGRRAPPLNLYPGNVAVLVTPVTPLERAKAAKTPTLNCPTRADPDRQCLAHPIEWAKRPKKAQAEAMLAATDQADGVSLLICSIAGDGVLTHCNVSGETTPETTAAILSLIPGFKAPAKSADRVPTTAGHLLVTFNWPLLRMGQAARTNDPNPRPSADDDDD